MLTFNFLVIDIDNKSSGIIITNWVDEGDYARLHLHGIILLLVIFLLIN